MADTSVAAAPKAESLPIREKEEEKIDTPAGATDAPTPAPAQAETKPEPASAPENGTAPAPTDGEPSAITEKTGSDAPPPAAVQPVAADHAVPKSADATTEEKGGKAAPTSEPPPKADGAAAAAAPEEKEPTKEKEATPKKTPFDELADKLPGIIEEVGHDEMWGVKLTSASTDVPTSIIVQKFLNANDGDLAKAADQLKGALKFRKEKKPLELLNKTFNAKKFANLGAVTVYPVKDSSVPEVFTWNLYGNVKDKMDEVFVPLDEFMDYRIALQELGIQQLKLSSATERISAESDPYKIIQVHDYKNISFFRQNSNVKAASTEIIKQFALAYPELLKEKFFVNVPAIMSWMYSVIKLFVAAKTAKKFHPMANGANLAAEFRGPGSGMDARQLPKEYGGEGGAGDGKMKDIPGQVDALRFTAAGAD